MAVVGELETTTSGAVASRRLEEGIQRIGVDPVVEGWQFDRIHVPVRCNRANDGDV